MNAIRLLALLLALAWALPAPAQNAAGERILSYDVDIAIQRDGSLEITETIAVRAEGRGIRRGITRDFPTRYRDRVGDRVVVDLEVLDVQRNGQPEPWFTERIDNGVRINTGNDDFLPVPAEHVFTLRYRTNRQLGFFENHDELYFNALGHGSVLRVEQARVTVRLPEPVPVADMLAEGFTGAMGARGQAFRVDLPEPGVARWELTGSLPPREGLTVVLAFPKGVVAEPGLGRKLFWQLKDNRAGLVALVGLALLLAYCTRRWRAVGRDPRQGTIIARYEPPSGYSPAELRVMVRRAYDNTAFSADLLAAAAAGALTIEREGRRLRSDLWTLRRRSGVRGSASSTPPGQLAGHLLPADTRSLELHHRNASTIQAAVGSHRKQVEGRIFPAHYRRHYKYVGGATAIAAGAGVATVLTLVFTGSGFLLAAGLLVAMVLVTIGFAILIGAPTPSGRQLLDEIEGFKRYLSVAEKQDLQQLQGPTEAEPELDAGRFERLLPYAVALDVEDAWTRKFTVAAGSAAVAAATSSIAWYAATGHNVGGGLSDVTRSLSSGLGSQIASASSPPGSSSGSSFGGGGGGFSGGGGGGGGVGGR